MADRGVGLGFVPPPPAPGSKRIYAIGRECVLTIDGKEVKGAADVMVRENVTETDATGFNAYVTSSAVTQWTWEISVTIPDLSYARWLHANRFVRAQGFLLPRIFEVSLSGGLVEFDERQFTINGVDADEPLDGAVVPRFTLKEWNEDSVDSAGQAGVIGVTGVTGVL